VTSPTLHINQLVCGYKNPVVRAEDFRFEPGTCTGIFGDNGSGKSTFLRTLAGLQPPLSGSILLDKKGLDELSHKERARKISFLTSQSPSPHGLTGRQVAAMGRLAHTGTWARPRKTDRDHIDKALELTSTLSLAEKRMSEMSDGERKRVMLAQCLAQDSQIILLDEPFAFLDARAKNAIHRLLVDIAIEQRKTIILSTHEIGISPPLLHYCLLIDRGKLHHSDAAGVVRHFA